MAGDDFNKGDEKPATGIAPFHTPATRQEPSPIAGMDGRTFSNFLTRALAGDDSVPPAILGRMRAGLRRGGNDQEERDREWWQAYFWQEASKDRLRDIDDLIGRYNAMADWHHEQAELARGRMREAADKLAEIDQFMSESDEVVDKLDKTGKLDREAAIRMLKARGVDVDPNADDATLFAELQKQRDRADRERIEWRSRYEEANGDADYHDDQERENRKKAQELVERRDAIRNGGYNPKEEEQKLREVSDEYAADIRRKAFEMEKRKIEEGQAQREIVNESQTEIDASQVNDEEAGFFASAKDLTGDFGKAVANVAKTTDQIPPALRNLPAPTGPVSSV